MPTGVGGADTTVFLEDMTLTAIGASKVSSTVVGASGASTAACIPTAASIAFNLSWVACESNFLGSLTILFTESGRGKLFTAFLSFIDCSFTE